MYQTCEKATQWANTQNITQHSLSRLLCGSLFQKHDELRKFNQTKMLSVNRSLYARVASAFLSDDFTQIENQLQSHILEMIPQKILSLLKSCLNDFRFDPDMSILRKKFMIIDKYSEIANQHLKCPQLLNQLQFPFIQDVERITKDSQLHQKLLQLLKFTGYLCDFDQGMFELLCAPLANSISKFFTTTIKEEAEQPRIEYNPQAKPFFSSRLQFFQNIDGFQRMWTIITIIPNPPENLPNNQNGEAQELNDKIQQNQKKLGRPFKLDRRISQLSLLAPNQADIKSQIQNTSTELGQNTQTQELIHRKSRLEESKAQRISSAVSSQQSEKGEGSIDQPVNFSGTPLNYKYDMYLQVANDMLQVLEIAKVQKIKNSTVKKVQKPQYLTQMVPMNQDMLKENEEKGPVEPAIVTMEVFNLVEEERLNDYLRKTVFWPDNDQPLYLTRIDISEKKEKRQKKAEQTKEQPSFSNMKSDEEDGLEGELSSIIAEFENSKKQQAQRQSCDDIIPLQKKERRQQSLRIQQTPQSPNPQKIKKKVVHQQIHGGISLLTLADIGEEVNTMFSTVRLDYLEENGTMEMWSRMQEILFPIQIQDLLDVIKVNLE